MTSFGFEQGLWFVRRAELWPQSYTADSEKEHSGARVDETAPLIGGCRTNHSRRRSINWSWDTTMPEVT